MDLPQKENISLNTYRTNKEIISEVIRQLEKDIVLAGGDFEMPPIIYDDILILKNNVAEYLNGISINNPALLFNLFYRVDIPQEIIENEPSEMAELLLKRELLKVLTRKYYGK